MKNMDGKADHETEEAYQEEQLRLHVIETQRLKCIELTPPLYRDTDPLDPRLNAELSKAVKNWNPESSKGLGLVGPTGQGKTRMLFMALHISVMAGKYCQVISHVEFSQLVIRAFSGDEDTKRDAIKRMERLKLCDVLLFDDVGKAPNTERSDSELLALIEYRTSWLKPTLWSANAGSLWMIDRFGPDRGEPIVRRLSEFSTIAAA